MTDDTLEPVETSDLTFQRKRAWRLPEAGAILDRSIRLWPMADVAGIHSVRPLTIQCRHIALTPMNKYLAVSEREIRASFKFRTSQDGGPYVRGA